MEEFSQIRPWVRWWARYVDSMLITLLIFPLLLQLPSEVRQRVPELVEIVASSILLILVEAILLSTWGYTPGKRLFRVAVRTRDGEKMTFLSSLNRALSVWFVGEGMNLPVLNLILPLMAYHRLKTRGKTCWDTVGDIQVYHEFVGFIPVVLTIFLTVLTLGVIIWF